MEAELQLVSGDVVELASPDGTRRYACDGGQRLTLLEAGEVPREGEARLEVVRDGAWLCLKSTQAAGGRLLQVRRQGHAIRDAQRAPMKATEGGVKPQYTPGRLRCIHPWRRAFQNKRRARRRMPLPLPCDETAQAPGSNAPPAMRDDAGRSAARLLLQRAALRSAPSALSACLPQAEG